MKMTTHRKPKLPVSGARDWDGEWNAARKSGTVPELIKALNEASHADLSAVAYLAMLYRDGVVVGEQIILKSDAQRSRSLFERAAKGGHKGALLEVANRLDALKSRRGTREARQIYSRLSRGGDPTAMLNLAISYLQQGEHRKAVGWLRKAAKRNVLSARLELAKAKYFGLGLRRSASDALRELVEISSRERLDVSPFEREQCLVFVARAYLDGWAVPRNYHLACAFLRRAEQLGSATATAMLFDLGEPNGPI